MQYAWMTFMGSSALVLIAVNICFKDDKPPRQKKALNCACGYVLGACFVFILDVVVFEQTWALLLYMVLSILMPVAVYYLVYNLKPSYKKKKPVPRHAASVPRIPKPSKQHALAGGQQKREIPSPSPSLFPSPSELPEVSAGRKQRPSILSDSERPPLQTFAKTSPQAVAPEFIDSQAPVVLPSVPQSRSSQITEKIFLPQLQTLPEISLPEPAFKKDPPVKRLRIPDAAEVMATMVIEPQDAFSVDQEAQKTSLMIKKDTCSSNSDSFEEKVTPTLDGETVAFGKEVSDSGDRSEKEDDPSFVFYFEQASLLREWGKEEIAAALFRESVILAQSEQERKRALFDALLCYVKCDDMKGVDFCVSSLEEMPDLSRFERGKIKAMRSVLLKEPLSKTE